MPVIQSNQITPEEDRQNSIGESILEAAPEIPGFKCIRGMAPLVVVALQKTNNPYITARKGFEEIGIEFDESGNQTTSPAEFAIAMLPKAAEAIVAMCCSRDDLKRYSRDPESLIDAALDLVEASTMDELLNSMVHLSEALKKTSHSRVTQSPQDEKPSAAAIKEGGEGSKKLVRTGSRKS